jgi:hypothetical protein
VIKAAGEGEEERNGVGGEVLVIAAAHVGDDDVALGTVPPELLARATKLRWICAARAGLGGGWLRSVCANPSVSTFTPALVTLYAVLPGGQVIPCLEPVLTIAAGVPWSIIAWAKV